MTSYNMPPGVTTNMIPGNNDEDYYTPDIRCKACGCFIGYTWQGKAKAVENEVHFITYHCKGGDNATCDNWFDCKEEHDWQDYDGVTSWYHCNYCGADTPVKEF